MNLSLTLTKFLSSLRETTEVFKSGMLLWVYLLRLKF
jgi:hypothetical protein